MTLDKSLIYEIKDSAERAFANYQATKKLVDLEKQIVADVSHIQEQCRARRIPPFIYLNLYHGIVQGDYSMMVRIEIDERVSLLAGLKERSVLKRWHIEFDKEEIKRICGQYGADVDTQLAYFVQQLESKGVR